MVSHIDMKTLELRYQRTFSFLESCISPPARILDLGVDNELARRMRDRGYDVANTPDVDLDFKPEVAQTPDVEAVTAFEILEHLVNPFAVLCTIQAPRLIATVPLRLWFAKAYSNPSDVFDQHFHEFEPWQFDRLLEKTGWEVQKRSTWTSPINRIGLRPLLRRYTPRYYAVDAIRKDLN